MPEEIIHETDLTGALEGIERATLGQCAMCDLHWHREQNQRGVIEVLEYECIRRSVLVEELRTQRKVLIGVVGALVVLELWRLLP